MKIYVDGSFLSLDRPVIRARDGGFLYGATAYEGLKIVDRRPLLLEEHLARLHDSAAALDIALDWPADELRPTLGTLLDDFDGRDAMARLYVTSGPPDGASSRLVWLQPIPALSAPDTPPLRLVCHREPIVPYRPDVKHTNRLPNLDARRDAQRRGADDALLVHADGFVLEGTRSNVFFFHRDALCTPAIECGVLGGITRDLVISLAPACGFQVREGRFDPETLRSAEEWFLTFTSAGVKPVARIDDQTRPAPGARTTRVREAYERHVAERLNAVAPV